MSLSAYVLEHNTPFLPRHYREAVLKRLEAEAAVVALAPLDPLKRAAREALQRSAGTYGSDADAARKVVEAYGAALRVSEVAHTQLRIAAGHEAEALSALNEAIQALE